MLKPDMYQQILTLATLVSSLVILLSIVSKKLSTFTFSIILIGRFDLDLHRKFTGEIYFLEILDMRYNHAKFEDSK